MAATMAALSAWKELLVEPVEARCRGRPHRSHIGLGLNVFIIRLPSEHCVCGKVVLFFFAIVSIKVELFVFVWGFAGLLLLLA